MIVVVSGGSDEGAAGLRRHWAGREVRLLTPRDLSTPGWSAIVPGSGRSTAVVEGQKTDTREISAVLTRLPNIGADQLPHIAASERAYVAAEMNAFLLWWLSDLACPVVNRPVPPQLSGPAWRPERWCAVAAGLGIPVEPVRRVALDPNGDRGHAAPDANAVVTVVGTRCIGEADGVLAGRARLLAAAASVDLLCATFTGRHGDARFVGADSRVDLSDGAVRDAVLELLEQR